MKHRYNILINIGDMIRASVYIEAKQLERVSHERVIADGVVIDLPGDIKRITKKAAK